MKKILLDNALESWSIAVKYCKYIKSGMVTLHYQKTFVSSLHNSVELFLKQIMIDNNNHRVANLRKVKNEADATLQLEYYKSKELNSFFKELDDEERYKFYSIGFDELVEKSNSLLKDILKSINIASIKSELEILQRLRNSETHFYISFDYLSEENFVKLHNMMIVIYKALHYYKLLPYWGRVPNFSEYYHLSFNEKEITAFSYKTAVINSSIAKSLKEVFSVKLYDFSYNSFYITEQYFNEIKNNGHKIYYDFNDVLAVVQMLNKYNLIECKDEVIQDGEDFGDGQMSSPLIEYTVNIKI